MNRLLPVAVVLLLISLLVGMQFGGGEGSEWEWQGPASLVTQGDFETIAFRPSGDQNSVMFPFELRRGASQGPDDWYIGYLSLQLEVVQLPRPASVRLTGSTNGFAFLQLLVDYRPHSGVTIYTTELVTGNSAFTTFDEVFVLAYANYLQSHGVHPGPNSLAVTASGDVDLLYKIAVLPDSGILRVPIGPPSVELEIDVNPTLVFPLDTPVTLPVSLVTNGWLIEDVVLSARTIEGDADAIVVNGRFDLLTGKGSSADLTIVPKQSGVTRIALTARGRNGAGHGILSIVAR